MPMTSLNAVVRHIRKLTTPPDESQASDAELLDRKSTRLNSSHSGESRMPSSA